MKFRRGTYIGPTEKLFGQEALLKDVGSEILKAQFDARDILIDDSLPNGTENNYGYCWHTMMKEDFVIEEEEDQND